MKKKIVSLMLVSTMVLSSLTGCGRGDSDNKDTSDSDKMNKKYEDYFDNVDDDVDEDVKYINLNYSLSGDNLTSSDTDLSTLKANITVPIVSDIKDMSINIDLGENGATTFAQKDNIYYVAMNNPSDITSSFSYKMNVDDFEKKQAESDSSSSLSVSDETFDSLSSALSSFGLYDTNDAYVYKETKEDGDKTYDVLSTDNGRTTVSVDVDEDSTENSDSKFSATYSCYINTETKLPDKFVTDITDGEKIFTITCDVTYLKDITIDSADSYGDTDYDTFSTSASGCLFVSAFGMMMFTPETYLNTSSSSSYDTSYDTEGTESIDDSFLQDDGTDIRYEFDGSEVTD